MEFHNRDLRILIIGANGAGKTVLAKKLSEVLGLKHIEIDKIFWKPEWEKSSNEEFIQKIKIELDKDTQWIVDGNYYRMIGDIVWKYANVIIWLDYSLSLVASRVIRRTITNIIQKRKLFDNNVDTFKRMLTPKDSIIVWSLKTFNRKRRKYRMLYENHSDVGVEFLRFGKPVEVEEFLFKLYSLNEGVEEDS